MKRCDICGEYFASLGYASHRASHLKEHDGPEMTGRQAWQVIQDRRMNKKQAKEFLIQKGIIIPNK